MNASSLCVIFIGGWGVAPEKKGNLFSTSDFLRELTSNYPVITLSPSDSVSEFYEEIGRAYVKEGNMYSLTTVLRSNHIPLTFLADADRYGLCRAMLDWENAGEEDNAQYFEMPPGASLSESPSLTLNEIGNQALEYLKRKNKGVFFICLSPVWSVARYKSIGVTTEAIKAVNKKVNEIAKKALDEEIPLLVMADGGLAEDYIDVETSSISAAPTKNPLPCILVDSRFQGLKGVSGEVGMAGDIPLQPSASAKDIAITILDFMNVTPPSDFPGKLMFSL